MLEEFLKAAVLGIVEGLTEFLPISSTGHLIIAADVLNFNAESAKTFEIFIQLGAIFAVVWFYRKKIFDYTKSTKQLGINIFLAFIPSVIAGIFIHQFMKEYLFQTKIVAIALIIGGITIFLIEKYAKNHTIDTLEKITLEKAFLIGLAQILAFIPGFSRSGATIMGGLIGGLDRVTATEFSFFLAIPTICAAVLFDLIKSASVLSSSDIPIFLTGFATAFITALFLIKVFLKFISKNTFKPFAWYRIIFGAIILIYVL